MTAKKNDDMNDKMVEFAPELASEYARYPLKRNAWLRPQDNGPKGEACFIAAPKGSPMKTNYVHGAGPKGWGYYHLLTPYAYKNLYARLGSESPVTCCACSKADRERYSDYEDVKLLMYNRSLASRPDDDQARKDAISQAQGVAQAHYHFDQNVQLIMMSN